jgi:hypothetical protein
METESPKADLTKSKLRRFQFSLRMLMVVVTAACMVGGILRWLTPISPLYACIASMWVGVVAVVICQFDFAKRLAAPIERRFGQDDGE